MRSTRSLFRSFLTLLVAGMLHPGRAGAQVTLRFEMTQRSADSLSVETLRFYVSRIRLHHKGHPVFTDSARARLVDALQSASIRLPFGGPFDSVHFCLGLDSLTNTAGVLEGDLDPSAGMYWTWQSGYVHFKFEGSVLADGRPAPFQYHIGGYRAPYPTLRQIRLAGSGPFLAIRIDPTVLLAPARSILSPGPPASGYADRLSRAFTVAKER